MFLNAKDTLVTEALDGLLMLAGGKLAKLQGFPHIKVIHRAPLDMSKVALISGGGSGHEPAHIGFVGVGMLTAAVCGEVFASPSVEAILAAILTVTGEPGCLLIVKNYTGDRLNFGLAAERARALGKKVEMVIVGDDIALPNNPQPRGVAGVLFVHKVAGHAAHAGRSLTEVTALAQTVASSVVSLGVALTSCTLPDVVAPGRTNPGSYELGLGIHGEPGAAVATFESIDATIDTLSRQIVAKLPSDAPRAVLINNLGSTTNIEMAAVARAVIASALCAHAPSNNNNVKVTVATSGSRVVHDSTACEGSAAAIDQARAEDDDVKVAPVIVFGPVAAMTALDMRGFSLSAIPIANPTIREALLSPVDILAWPHAHAPAAPVETPVAEGAKLHNKSWEASSRPSVRTIVTIVCEVLTAAEVSLNNLDAAIGDGDTGSTFATAARAILEQAEGLPFADIGALLAAVGHIISATTGGSSGVLLAIFFAATADAVGQGMPPYAALSAGVERMSAVGGAQLGDRTMIDALGPAADALNTGSIISAAMAARQGADATGKMNVARAGRASYIPSAKLVGHNDPGAEAIARIFEAVAAAVAAGRIRAATSYVEGKQC